jgi:hypothetical protein
LVSRIVGGISFFTVIGFAVIVGFLYFLYDLTPEKEILYIPGIALAIVLLMGLASLITIFLLLISSNMNHDTRNVLIIVQFGYLTAISLFLTIVLGILGFGGEDLALPIGDITLPISLELLFMMFLLFVVALLVPYRSGWERGKRWREQLLKKKQTRLDELLDILDFPTPSLYVPKLQQVLKGIESDKIIAEQGEEISRLEDLCDDDTRELDPRLGYSDFLKKLQDRIKENIAQFEALKDDEDLLTKRASIYVEAYRIRKDEIAKAIEMERQAKPQLWITLAVILTPILLEFIRLIMPVLMQSVGLGAPAPQPSLSYETTMAQAYFIPSPISALPSTSDAGAMTLIIQPVPDTSAMTNVTPGR